MTSAAEAALLRLRETVQPLQLDLRTALWDNYLSEGQWIPAREFHHLASGKTAARQALKSLGGAVVWCSDEPDSRYNLTPLGVLLTRRGPELEGLLVQWLLYLKERYWHDPKFSQVGVEEARGPLKLRDDQDAHLGRLIAMASGFWGQSGSGQMPWTFGPPQNIDELAEKSTPDLVEYLHEQIMADYLEYGPELPIDGRERHGALMKSYFTFVPGPDGR